MKPYREDRPWWDGPARLLGYVAAVLLAVLLLAVVVAVIFNLARWSIVTLA